MPITPQQPPTDTPVLERITQNIIDTLATIMKENGYSVDAKVKKINPGVGDSTFDGQILVALGDLKIEGDRPETSNQFRQEFLICCDVKLSELAGDPDLERLRTLRRAEIEWALTTEAFSSGDRPNQTRGGLAEDTILTGITLPAIDPSSHETFAVLHFEVLYRTQFNNPFKSTHEA